MARNRHRYDFFILYDEQTEQDGNYAHRIMEYLEQERQLSGYAEFRDGQAGQSIFKNFEHALNNSRYVLVLISSESIKDNWWDRQVETSLFHRLHGVNKDTVVPIYLPNLDTEDLPVSLSVFVGVHYNNDINDRFWTKLACVFD